MKNSTVIIPKLYRKLEEFCKENEIGEIPMNIRYISGEVVKGECGEIREKEELRCDFEDEADGLEEYESFEEFWEEATAMGGYFWRSVPYYFCVLLDGRVMEDENCASARFDDIEEALEEAYTRSGDAARYDYKSGEYIYPEISVECYFCG